MSVRDILQLACLVFAAVTSIVFGDTAGKLLTARGLDPIFIAWTRFALAALVFLPFSGLSWREAPNFRDWRVLLRGAFITGGICCILTALRTEPIANVFGAFFIGPVVSYILAITFLRETPSRSRSVLLAIGFLGVMLVVKPGFGASIGMAFAVAAGVFHGAYLAMTRTVAGVYRPRFLLVAQLLVGAAILTPLGLGAEFPEFDISIGLLILLSAFGSALGNYLLVVANKAAEASLIAPLVYSQLFSATAAGVVVFGDWPDAYSLVGLVLIAFSGFGSLAAHRNAARKRARNC